MAVARRGRLSTACVGTGSISTGNLQASLGSHEERRPLTVGPSSLPRKAEHVAARISSANPVYSLREGGTRRVLCLGSPMPNISRPS